MQNCRVLTDEIEALALEYGASRILVSMSSSIFSPVSAVAIRGLELPDNSNPATCDISIPIPDLFGFAADTSVILFRCPVRIGHKSDTRTLPFLETLNDEHIALHRDYFVCFREASSMPGTYYLCLTPSWSPGAGYKHLTLPEFVQCLIEYIKDPCRMLREDLAHYSAAWEILRTPWALARVGHTLEGLGNLDRAQQVYEEGTKRFPDRAEFQRLLRRVESKSG